jgi:prepilin-type N-terminal cleavage/methylation domain-containing protein/prepilin-type processing-associated H-X9-DG protein
MIMHKPQAFSLVELLVVIAIITMLMGISLPSLQKVKERAKAAVCVSNMRQIGFAAELYADNSDLFIPRGTTGSTAPWFQLFMPYLDQRPINDDYRNVKIYRCPSYPDKQQTVCYVVNGWAFSSESDMTGYETVKPTKLTECRRRAYTNYLADNEYGRWRHIITKATDEGVERCDVWHEYHLPDSDMEHVIYGRRVARNRHREGSNCLYLDWHVGWVAAEDMTIDMWRFNIP